MVCMWGSDNWITYKARLNRKNDNELWLCCRNERTIKGTSLEVQWLRLHTSTAGVLSSIQVRELDPTCCNKDLACHKTEDPECHNEDPARPSKKKN